MANPWEEYSQPAVDKNPWDDYSQGHTVSKEGSSQAKAFGKSAVESTAPSIAALAAFGPGMETGAGLGALTSPLTGPVGPAVGGVIGGLGASLAAGYAASKLQEGVAEAIPSSIKKATGFDKATRQKETEENPWTSFAGALAPNLLSFRPGSLETVKIGGKEFGSWAQRAFLATTGAGLEAGQEAYHGEKVDPLKVATAAVFQGVAAKPTQFGEKLMSSLSIKKPATVAPDHKEWTTKNLREKFVLPKEYNGVPIREGIVEADPHPESLKEAAFLNKETGEIIPSGARHDPALKDSALPLEQGFIDHSGNFVNRLEAAGRAYKYHPNMLKNDVDFTGQKGPTGAETRMPGLHSTDFGPQGLKHLEDAPKKNATRADGSPVLARHYRDKDGNSIEIVLNKDAIINDFVNKPWANPKVDGVNPLPEDFIKTPEDLVQFYALHEMAHTQVRRPSWVSKADHENLVNEMAMEKFNEQNLGRTTPDATVPKVPTTNQELADSLFTFGKTAEADNVVGTKLLQAAEEEGVTQELKVKFRQYAEGTPGVKLEGKELELFNKYYTEPALELKALVKHASDEGIISHVDIEDGVFPRMSVAPEMSKWEQFKKNLFDPGKGGFDQNIEKVPGAGMERGLFVLEHPNGKRSVIQERGGKLYQYNNNNQIVLAKSIEGLKAGDKFGSSVVKEARVDEIEQHTPFRYNKDSQAVLYKKLSEMRSLIRAHEFIKELKNSDYFKENAVALEAGKQVPDGYVTLKNPEKVPQLRDYAFQPRTAEIIDDFSKVWDPNALTMMSGALIKNMMLNPIPHMLNEAWHVYNARGITGWITPAGIGRFVSTGIPALKEAMVQGPEFRSMLKDGASLLSADVRNSPIQESMFKRGAKEFVNTPEGQNLAKQYSMSLGELYDALSKKSSAAMWTVRDAMYIQMVKEKMKYENLSQKDAIKEVERHLPNYRINARVGEKVMGGKLSRGLSQVLQNPNVSVFSRYHYGMVNSLIETGKDLAAIRHGKAGLKQFGHGLDTTVAMGVAIAILYPLQDMLAAKLFNNENAEQRRAGPYHIFHAIQEVAQDKKDGAAVLAAVFTFNPVLLMAAQLAFNRKLYNGQQVYHPGSEAPDLAKYFFGQVPQLQSTLAVSDEKTGGGSLEWIAKQVDVKAPSDEKARKMDKIQRRNQRAAENRRRKREYME